MDKKKKSTTIKSYISAVKAILFQAGIKIKENRAVIMSVTKACQLHTDRIYKPHLPIKKGMLRLILNETDNLFKDQQYLAIMYKALFATSYFGLFRIGELTKSPHVVKAMDVQMAINKNKLQFILRSLKTHTEGMKPQIIKISSTAVSTTSKSIKYCPFSLIRNYIQVQRK